MARRCLMVLLFFLLSVRGENRTHYRILAIFPHVGKSHFVVPHAILTHLANRGHQVDVFSHFSGQEHIPNYRGISLRDNATPEVSTSKEFQRPRMTTFEDRIRKVGDRLCGLIALPELQNLIKNPPTDPPYDILFVEFVRAPCFLAFGAHLKIPTIAYIINYRSWSMHYTQNTFVPFHTIDDNPDMKFWELAKTAWMESRDIRKIHKIVQEQDKYVRNYFGPNVPPIKELYKTISLVLTEFHHTVTDVHQMDANVINLGGFQTSDIESPPLSPDIQQWLDTSKSGCIFFSLGSETDITAFEGVQDTFYAVFRNISPTRVIMNAEPSRLAQSLPKNVLVRSWLPQMSILKHQNVKVSITQGGLKGVQAAISCGIPSILIPLHYDQWLLARYLEEERVAILLNSPTTVTEEDLANAIYTILNDPIYRINAKKLSKLFNDRPMQLMDTAVYWIEYIARHKNVLELPVQLTWWQENSLDVYVVLLLSTLVILYTALHIVKRMLQDHSAAQKLCEEISKEHD